MAKYNLRNNPENTIILENKYNSPLIEFYNNLSINNTTNRVNIDLNHEIFTLTLVLLNSICNILSFIDARILNIDPQQEDDAVNIILTYLPRIKDNLPQYFKNVQNLWQQHGNLISQKINQKVRKSAENLAISNKNYLETEREISSANRAIEKTKISYFQSYGNYIFRMNDYYTHLVELERLNKNLSNSDQKFIERYNIMTKALAIAKQHFTSAQDLYNQMYQNLLNQEDNLHKFTVKLEECKKTLNKDEEEFNLAITHQDTALLFNNKLRFTPSDLVTLESNIQDIQPDSPPAKRQRLSNSTSRQYL